MPGSRWNSEVSPNSPTFDGGASRALTAQLEGTPRARAVSGERSVAVQQRGYADKGWKTSVAANMHHTFDGGRVRPMTAQLVGTPRARAVSGERSIHAWQRGHDAKGWNSSISAPVTFDGGLSRRIAAQLEGTPRSRAVSGARSVHVHQVNNASKGWEASIVPPTTFDQGVSRAIAAQLEGTPRSRGVSGARSVHSWQRDSSTKGWNAQVDAPETFDCGSPRPFVAQLGGTPRSRAVSGVRSVHAFQRDEGALGICTPWSVEVSPLEAFDGGSPRPWTSQLAGTPKARAVSGARSVHTHQRDYSTGWAAEVAPPSCFDGGSPRPQNMQLQGSPRARAVSGQRSVHAYHRDDGEHVWSPSVPSMSGYVASGFKEQRSVVGRAGTPGARGRRQEVGFGLGATTQKLRESSFDLDGSTEYAGSPDVHGMLSPRDNFVQYTTLNSPAFR